jgi:hypothetical protein
LTAKNEPGALQSGADFTTGQIGGELGHVVRAGKLFPYAASISMNSLPASVGIGSPASRQSSM